MSARRSVHRSNPDICFDVPYLYYLTQFRPVITALRDRGNRAHLVLYHGPDHSRADLENAVRDLGVSTSWVANQEEGAALYRRREPDWVVFGQAFKPLAELTPRTRTAQLYHGIGMKSDVYIPELCVMDVRFTEGSHYTAALRRAFPRANLVEVGYAKVDPLFWPSPRQPRKDIAAMGLDPAKQTLMYAPTFFPSSFGAMADSWPQHFAAFNLIVKAHQFSHSGTRPYYRAQQRKMQCWARAANIYVVPANEFDPIPFMAVTDLLISDASSILFEFAATGRPVVWCDFLELRWSYRGPLRYRLTKRLDASIRAYADIGAHARRYPELLSVVEAELSAPDRNAARRRDCTERLIGRTDGRTGERIAQYLLGSAIA